MNNNTFYDENLQQGRTGNKRGAPGIPVIAMSIFDGTEYWFPSLTCAANSLNVSATGISLCLRGEMHQSGGYHFRYADKTPIEPQSQNLEALAEWRRKMITSSNKKPVIATNLEDGSEQFFLSEDMAAKELGGYANYIYKSIKRGKNYIPNYSFRYATEEDIR